jgi:hypothetical protein
MKKVVFTYDGKKLNFNENGSLEEITETDKSKDLFILWTLTPSLWCMKNVVLEIGTSLGKMNNYGMPTPEIEIPEDEDTLCANVYIDGELGNKKSIKCAKIQVKNGINTVYFLEIGENYYDGAWIHFADNKEYLVNLAIKYFNNEHNRDKKCKFCPNCEKDMIQTLRNENWYNGYTMRIWSVKVKC